MKSSNVSLCLLGQTQINPIEMTKEEKEVKEVYAVASGFPVTTSSCIITNSILINNYRLDQTTGSYLCWQPLSNSTNEWIQVSS